MQKEIIYQIMNGDMDLDRISLVGDVDIENEFSENRECEQLYNEVYNAKLRLVEKIGEEEDTDIEQIINCMSRISRILAFKMYDYALKIQNENDIYFMFR